MSDLIPVETHQRRREPTTWKWEGDEHFKEFTYVVNRPAERTGPPALLLGTTDRIDDARIFEKIPDASIWRVTIASPNNDFLKSRLQLRKFRDLIRPLLDEIKNAHGMSETIHVFPATSVAIAVEFGRCVQPKITPPLKIYDNISSHGGFLPVLTIGDE